MHILLYSYYIHSCVYTCIMFYTFQKQLEIQKHIWKLNYIMAKYIMLSVLHILEGILYIRYSSCWTYKSRLVQQSLYQFSSVTHLCLTLCHPMDCSMPGLPVHHQLPELAQTHVHRVGDAIQPSHPLSSPSSPAFNLSQHQSLFQ